VELRLTGRDGIARALYVTANWLSTTGRSCVALRRHVIDAQRHEIASAQFAVDRQVEQGQVAYTQLKVQLGPNGPDMPRSQWRPWPDELALVPW
jgi:hypothetical protein